jgi:hypothetical protein
MVGGEVVVMKGLREVLIGNGEGIDHPRNFAGK